MECGVGIEPIEVWVAQKKSQGFWRSFDNVREVIEDWSRAHAGRFPNQKELVQCGLGSIVQAIHRYHGGMGAIRVLMGVAECERRPNGYWRDFENVRRALSEWSVENGGRFPSHAALRQTDYSTVSDAINKYHGGIRAVRARTGSQFLGRKPPGYWRDFENISRQATDSADKVFSVDDGAVMVFLYRLQ